METDTRSSLGQSASETEEDTVSVSKKEVWDGAESGRNVRRQYLGTKVTPVLSDRCVVAAILCQFLSYAFYGFFFSFNCRKSLECRVLCMPLFYSCKN